MQNLADELLTVSEAAAFLKVPRSWLYERTRLGQIPLRRIGPRLIRISRAELLAWIEAQQPAQALGLKREELPV